MYSTIRPTYVPNPRPAPTTTENGEQPGTVCPRKWRPEADATRSRVNWVTIGFWLGALALSTGGCLIGASMPCRHPTGVTIAMVWWGGYLGCFGASIGAGVGGLFGLWWDRPPASPPRTGASGHRR
jgi:hypothetical protein